jgi:hypothetical protein
MAKGGKEEELMDFPIRRKLRALEIFALRINSKVERISKISGSKGYFSQILIALYKSPLKQHNFFIRSTIICSPLSIVKFMTNKNTTKKQRFIFVTLCS